MLDPGFEPGLPRPQRGVLTSRLIELIRYVIFFKKSNSSYKSIIIKWRTRVSISVPRACKARALPIELVPHVIVIIEIKRVIVTDCYN